MKILNAAALILFSVLAACHEDSPCDGATEFVGKSCVDKKAPVPDAAPVKPTTSTFGDVCSDSMKHSDCAAPMDYCAKIPGQPAGYCTRKGCNDMPALCPTGWSCFNVAMFSPGEPFICLKPS